MRFFFLLASLALLATACTPETLTPPSTESPEYIIPVSNEVLQKDRIFTNGITFPAGTQLTKDGDGNQLGFELPLGYRTLIYNQTTMQVVLGNSFGSYSCTCSGEKSCITFSTPDDGYGCMQSNCTGSCTGVATGEDAARLGTQTLAGIVFGDESIISFSPSSSIVSIAPEFQSQFFGSELFATALSEVHNQIYNDRTDFTPPQQENNHLDIVPTGYVAIPAYVLGVEFAMTVPASQKLLKYLAPGTVDLAIANGQKSTTCTGADGCNCEKDSVWTPSGRIYYCSGCTTCTINDDREQ